jgi:outer membrane murein-binding lipoprotein Lpp
MTDKKSATRFLIGAALATSTLLVVGCESSERVTRSTTTDQTSTAIPTSTSESTTTTQDTRP